MSIFQSIARLFRREGTTETAVATPRTGGVRFYMPGENSAMSIATVYRCVKLISDSVACLNFQYMRLKDGRYQEDLNSTLHYLLTVQPQPEMSAYNFWSLAVQQMLLEGNAYIYPRYVNGELTDLVLCRSGSVSQDTLNMTYTISDAYNGVYGTFGEKDIIHLYLHSTDGRKGESVISNARRTLDIASTGDGETLNRFANGGNVRGIVTNDKSVTGIGEYADEQLDRLASNTDDLFQNGERIVSLPGQVDFKQISLTSTDMQFLESRKFTVRDICRFFGVQPSFAFDDTSNNYKSAETANVSFLSTTLNPILRRIENEMNRKLIPRQLCCKRIFRFDRRGIYSLDLDSKASYQMKTIQNGTFTINDWRRMENQPTVEGGDTVYISTNLAPLGSAKISGGAAESPSAEKSQKIESSEE